MILKKTGKMPEAAKGFSIIYVFNDSKKLEHYLVRNLEKQTIPKQRITFCSRSTKRKVLSIRF